MSLVFIVLDTSVRAHKLVMKLNNRHRVSQFVKVTGKQVVVVDDWDIRNPSEVMVEVILLLFGASLSEQYSDSNIERMYSYVARTFKVERVRQNGGVINLLQRHAFVV